MSLRGGRSSVYVGKLEHEGSEVLIFFVTNNKFIDSDTIKTVPSDSILSEDFFFFWIKLKIM